MRKVLVLILLFSPAVWAQSIFNLPPATLPLSGTECTIVTQPCSAYPVGKSKQVTLSQLTTQLPLQSQRIVTVQPPNFAGNLNPVNLLAITADNTTSPGFIEAVAESYNFGGPGVTGGRIGNYAQVQQTAPTSSSNPSRNYVGSQGSVFTTSGDGGTNLTTGAQGAYFAFGGNAYLPSAATNVFELTGGEVDTDTQAGSSTEYLIGWSIVGNNAVQGSTLDAAIDIGGDTTGVYGPHVGWHYGIVFDDIHSKSPVNSSTTLIGGFFPSLGRQTVTNGIDFSQFSITGAVLQSQAMVLTDNTLNLGANVSNVSAVSAGAGVTNANLDLNAKGGGAVRIADTISTHVLVNSSTDDGVHELQVTGSTNITGALTAGTGSLIVYGTTGVALSTPHSVTGSATMTGGTATVTLSGSAVYTSSTTYICSANDATAANAVSVQNQSGTSVKFVGTAGDIATFVCVGS